MFELNDIRCQLPNVERALVLAPHPDDETLGCGGTIAVHSERIHFTVIALSRGEAVNIDEENVATLRKSEFEAAMRVLNIEDYGLLDMPDGQFQRKGPELKERLAELFSLKKPQLVFVPSPMDAHSDHRETAVACIELTAEFPSAQIVFYEIYQPVRFNTLIDVGSVIEAKREALRKYHYSMLKKENLFISSFLALNKFRSFHALADSYYEAFWIPNPGANLSDILGWLTYDLSPPSPEDSLLSAIRVADAFISEVRKLESDKADKERSVESLALELEKKEAIISDLDKMISLMKSSLFWRLAGKFHRARDLLVPEGTGKRRLYEKITSLLKNL